MGVIAQRLDELGKPAWIGLLVISFILFWPAGLVLLAYLFWSGRMGCMRNGEGWKSHKWRHHMRSAGRRWGPHSSGNVAFDEYRDETLRRLEEEQREFRDFLDRLRHAKDKAEFDQFMSEGRRPQPPADTADI